MPGVLLIDDDLGTLESFGGVLRAAGFDVTTARTGREGLTLARRPTVDLVLADLRLADMTGLDVLRQLRRDVVDVPFVIVTGFASTASAVEAGKLGAAEYVEKPVFADHLLDVVATYTRPPHVHPTSPDERPAGRTNPQAVHATQLIEERYADAALGVRSVARDLGVSTEHLCRVLKHHTGQTFVALLRRARTDAARQLLRATTLSMKQIADRVGFRTASQFYRDFKKLYGTPPTEYRIASLRRSQSHTLRP